MTENAIAIREFHEGDLETVIEFSLRAWAPVFASLRNVLGDGIFLRLHPDWKANQAEAGRAARIMNARSSWPLPMDARSVSWPSP